MLVLEPIFEADLPPEQYAYRRGRDAREAVKAVRALLASGHTQVVDADLKGYFDSLPHPELLKAVARRVSDKHVRPVLPIRDGQAVLRHVPIQEAGATILSIAQ